MFTVQTLLRANARSAVNSTFVRTLVSTPPRVRVSFAEKVVHGVAIAAGVTFTPIWIIVHLDNYKKKS